MPMIPTLRRVIAITPILTSVLLLAAACANQSPTTPASPPASASVAPSAAATASTGAAPVPAIPLPSPFGESTSVRQPDGTFLFTPGSGRVGGGVLYRYVAFTHCGFTPTTFDFDGSFWTVANAAGGTANAPAGIGNPEDVGTIALVGPNEAVFTSSSGILVPLIRADGPQAGFPCD